MAFTIPKTFINELQDRVDIAAVIGSRVTLKKGGKDLQGLCPFHDEKTPSFTVSPAKNMYYCFGCGAGGDAIKFLEEFEGLSFTEAVESLAATVGMEVPREQSKSPARDLTPLFDAMRAAEGFYKAQLKASPEAIDYLKGRGLTGQIAAEFKLGFAPDAWNGLRDALAGGAHPVPSKALLEAGLIGRNESGREYDRFRGRVMFPVRDGRGRIIAFGGRLLGEGQGPKYLNSPETPIFHKSQELYGLFEARKSSRRLESLIVVEGYLDVIALAQAGIRNTVATLGTATGEDHYRKLYRYADEVICCFDGDAAGRRAAWKALEGALGSLSGGRRLKFMFLPDGEDPDSLVRQKGADDFRRRIGGATPAIEYLFTELTGGLDLTVVDDRARLAHLVDPYVQRAPADSPLRQMMRNRLRELTGFAADGPQPQRARAAPRRAAGRRDALPQQLLSLLLKSPDLAAELDPADVDLLADGQDSPLFAEVIRYAAAHAGADAAQLLGRWSGQEGHAELLRLHQRPSMLDAEGLAVEFREGLERLRELAGRRQRSELVERMRGDPAEEKERLAEYMALRQSAEAP
ncbi:MAG: DNA primase, partial [Gammaproteobacteria bacterium]|nr:DNA primase [Gammaproteobacteria bacterium]MYG13744.1 DNA primase [Gammaproteobacteria bacterium]